LSAVPRGRAPCPRLNAAGVAEYDGVSEELGTEVGYHGGGSLGWAEPPGEQARLRERTARLAARGYPAEWITPDEARRLEPGLEIAGSVEGVAWHAGDGWLDAPRLVRALVNRALAEGADLWRGISVTGV